MKVSSCCICNQRAAVSATTELMYQQPQSCCISNHQRAREYQQQLFQLRHKWNLVEQSSQQHTAESGRYIVFGIELTALTDVYSTAFRSQDFSICRHSSHARNKSFLTLIQMPNHACKEFRIFGFLLEHGETPCSNFWVRNRIFGSCKNSNRIFGFLLEHGNLKRVFHECRIFSPFY